jgi:hypothetical protein
MFFFFFLHASQLPCVAVVYKANGTANPHVSGPAQPQTNTSEGKNRPKLREAVNSLL